jgi:hypothetical protein
MKKTLFISVITLFSFASFAQSVSINPNNLQIPSVSALPACAAADYGKIVFLTTTNKANVCSGSGWVEVAAGGGSLTLPYTSNGSFSTQGFQIINTGGGANSAALQGTTSSALTDAAGVWGSANETNPTGNNAGLRGSNFSSNTLGYGVYGTHAGTGFGVFGVSVNGTGVRGVATGTIGGGVGVYGESSGPTSIAGSFVVTNTTATAGRFVSPANFNNTGRALHTTGSIRFANIGESAGKFLKSIDANGVAIWDNITRSDVKTFLPSDFVANISNHVTTIATNGLSFSSLSSGTSAVLYANLDLPDLAVVSSFKLIYFDNDASASILSCELQRVSNISSTWASFAAATIPTTNSASLQSVTFNLPISQIYNATTTHYRVAVVMNASANVAIRAVEVSYSYTFDQ